MKVPFWALKNDSRNLIRGHWNILVLTLFIPFIIYVAMMGKFTMERNSVESIAGLINNPKFIFTLVLIMYLFFVATVAIFEGLNEIKKGEKPNIFKMYKTGFSNTIRYIPTFLVAGVLPNLIAYMFSPELLMKFYDYLIFAVVDVKIFNFFVSLLQIAIILLNFYISLSVMFVPIILVEKEAITGYQAVKESFKLSKGIRWYLFFFCISFFGWFILGTLALFIGIIWAGVYYFGALYSYYTKISSANVTGFDENQITIEALEKLKKE